MTYLTLSRPSVWSRFLAFCKTLVLLRDSATSSDDLQEDSLARRDFILQMLDSSPDAFQSELDVELMARLYRCKF